MERTSREALEAGIRPAPAAPGRSRRRAEHGPAIDRRRLVETLQRIGAAEGLEAITMPRIASELGASLRTLYYHVRDRDTLCQILADSLFADCSVPGGGPPWEDRLGCFFREMATTMRGVRGLAAWSLVRILNAPSSLHARRLRKELMDLLTSIGLTPAQALEVRLALNALLMGAVALMDSAVDPASTTTPRKVEAGFERGLAAVIEGVRTTLREAGAPG